MISLFQALKYEKKSVKYNFCEGLREKIRQILSFSTSYIFLSYFYFEGKDAIN